MAKIIPINRARFSIGDVVHHRKFDYRGVIFDADPTFQLTDEWYDVLVEGSDNTTYVAERNLEKDSSGKPIDHPMVDELFSRFENGHYVVDRQ